MRAGTYSSEQERRASQYQGDGLLDIGLGLALLIVGLAMYGDWPMSFVGVWVILWMFGGRAAKRKITLPRLASIDFSPSPEAERRQSYLKQSTIGLILLVFLLSFFLFVFSDRLPVPVRSWVDDGSGLVIGLIGLTVLLLLGLAGWATGARRLVVYAVLGILGWIATELFGVDIPLIVLALGGVILGVGIYLLTQFLQNHPLPGN
jgi:hypothetical protein